MISASKSTLSLNNLKILRPKVTKNLTNLRKKFCELPPRTRAVVRPWERGDCLGRQYTGGAKIDK